MVTCVKDRECLTRMSHFLWLWMVYIIDKQVFSVLHFQCPMSMCKKRVKGGWFWPEMDDKFYYIFANSIHPSIHCAISKVVELIKSRSLPPTIFERVEEGAMIISGTVCKLIHKIYILPVSRISWWFTNCIINFRQCGEKDVKLDLLWVCQRW